jgi:hypothetical protein
MGLTDVLIDGVLPLVEYVQAVLNGLKGVVDRIFALNRLYGLSGLVVAFCGSSKVWEIEAKLLGELDDKHAAEFKKSIQDECSMIAVAVRF